MAKSKICDCGNCLRSLCVSSDSGLTVKKCWCAECADRRNQFKEMKFVIRNTTPTNALRIEVLEMLKQEHKNLPAGSKKVLDGFINQLS